MKKILFFSLFLFSNWAYGQCPANTILSENFEAATAANPPTGWDTPGVDYAASTFNDNRKCMGINTVNSIATPEYAITKLLFCPGPVSFVWRSSGTTSAFIINIDYSFDKVNWTTAGTLNSNVANRTTFQSFTVNMPNANFIAPFKTYIRWVMASRTSTSGTFYMDDLCIGKGTCSVVPTQVRFFDNPTQCIGSNVPFNLKVCATDNNGYIDSTYAGTVNLNLTAGTGTLSGSTSAVASQGCAVFSAVKFSGIAPLTIAASSGALNSTNNVSTLDIKTKCPNVDTLKLVTYNLLNFPLGGTYALGGACSPDILSPNRADTLAKVIAYMKPDMMIVQELQTAQGATDILTKAMNINGVTNYAMAPFIENQSTANKKYNNELFYNTTKWALKKATFIKTSTRDCTYYIMYGKDPNLSVHKDTTFIDVLSMHTKARGLTKAEATADSLTKMADCKAVVDSIRKWYPGPRNIVFGGDLNLYDKAEGAFQVLTTGSNKFNDPVPEIPGGDGKWESNPAYAILHSQASRCKLCLSVECGATGGLDSRLDFWLASDPVMDGSKRMKYIDNSYKILGNDGTKYNKSINLYTGPNGRIAAQPNDLPQVLLNTLFNMSDHLPLEMKLKVTYPDNTILPLERISITGKWVNNEAVIDWKIIDNQLISKIILLRANDKTGSGYIPIFETNEVGLVNQFIDEKILPGENYYKLKIIEFSGNEKYSKIIRLKLDATSRAFVSPNPFTNELIVNTFHQNQTEITQAKLFDNTGKNIGNFEIMGLGKIQFKYPTDQLPSGFYYLKLINGVDISTLKVVKY